MVTTRQLLLTYQEVQHHGLARLGTDLQVQEQ